MNENVKEILRREKGRKLARLTEKMDKRRLNSYMETGFAESLITARRGDRALDDERHRSVRGGVRTKLIVSGGIVERYDYQLPVQIGKQARIIDPETGEVLNGGRTKDVELDADGNVVKREQKKTAKRANARRSKMELRRLVLSNFTNMDKFVTLTFRDGSVLDVRNVDECNKAFDKFLKRIRRLYPEVKYCRVIEFQDGKEQNVPGRGAVHYHCILSLPYIPYEKLGEIWGNGYVGINAIDHVDNVGAYISKYMQKNLDDARLANKKAFATSQNVSRSITLYGREAEEQHEQFLADKPPSFSNTYPSEWQGEITYREYNLKRDGQMGRNPFRRD